MSKGQFYFLHLEGMDLAGKSSVAKAIQEKSNIKWKISNNRLYNENEIYNFISEVAKKNLYDDEIYGYLYYVALFSDLKKYELSTNVIQDSTILLRSINYHIENNNKQLAEMFIKLVKLHPVPNCSIYLTADINSRIRRLAERIEKNPEKISKNDSMIISNPEKFKQMDDNLFFLSQKYFNSILLDTTNLTIDEVADYIINYCNLDTIECNKQLKKKRD